MAKEDFCFTYYDGDATRDMSHMNRLERGCYTDIIISQRKFGRLSLTQIQKILSRDFEECWPAIELILLKDDEGKYYIEWLEESINKMRKNAKKNKERIQKHWDEKNGNTKSIPNEESVIPKSEMEIPLENENGNGNEEEKKGGTGENKFVPAGIVPEMAELFVESNPNALLIQNEDFPAIREIAEKIHKWLKLSGTITDSENRETIKHRWGELLVHAGADGFYSKFSLPQLNKHLSGLIQSYNNRNKTGNGNSKQQSTGGARDRQARTSQEVWDEIGEFQKFNSAGSGVDSAEVFGTGIQSTD